jgi:hypothetical protein
MNASRATFFPHTCLKVAVGTAAWLTTLLCTTAAPSPSTNDLWDLSRGVVVTAHSAMLICGSTPDPFDARDILGGSFSMGCRDGEHLDNVMFADFHPDGYVDFVE